MSDDTHRGGIMVTGAAGFIGSRIVRRLLIDGFPVLGFVRSTDPGKLVRLRSVLSRRGGVPLRLIACDLHDEQAVSDLIITHRPSMCVHAAWSVSPETYRDDPANDRWVGSSLKLLDALDANDCEWIGVCGTCIEPLGDESASCRYAAAKSDLRLQMTKFLSGSDRRGRAQLCWWRIFQPYGPGEPPQRLIPSLIDSLARGKPFTVNSPHEVRDFVHVDDIAAAAAASMVHRAEGSFDLGTGVSCSIAAMAETAAGILRSPNLLRFADTPLEASHPDSNSSAADPQPLLAVANWRAEIDLRHGLSLLINQHRRRTRVSA